jgi:nucleoside-diphosphate-sugar epimerase
MKTVVIGGTGHIGTYLVPRLIEAGHTVLCISRGNRKPYQDHPAWDSIEMVKADSRKENREGVLGPRLKELDPDIVIDMLPFSKDDVHGIIESLKGNIQHYLATGTLWVHGYAVSQPVTEDRPRNPVGNYGTRKAEMEQYLIKQYNENGFPATILHPGHITGPGWDIVNPQGNHNPQVFADLAAGKKVALPGWGLHQVHHVHADDIAQLFMKAIEFRDQALGQSFHALSPGALTLRGFAEAVCSWFDRKPDIEYLPWDEWKKTVSIDDADDTYEHISRSLVGSIEKAQQLLNYKPSYTSLEACKESVEWMIDNKVISIQ